MAKKKEILIDKELYQQLEELALSMPTPTTADKLAEVFLLTGISQIAMFGRLMAGGDPIAELKQQERP